MRCLLTSVFVAILAGPLPAGAGSGASPDPFTGFDAIVEAAMTRWQTPGVAMAVVKDGSVVLLRGYGYRDMDQRLKVTPQTLFRIGSITKSFTAMAVGLLVDRGQVDWDKPIQTYLPGFHLQDDHAARHATPRDLLCHRTGLADHYGPIYLSRFNRREIVERLRYLEPAAGFRERHVYNNLMYITLGLLVEEASGKSWERFLTEDIFAPLGMNDSTPLSDGLAKRANAALPYDPRNTEQLREIFHENTGPSAPAGSIASSAEEMSRWLLLHLNRGRIGEKTFVSFRSLSEMHAPQSAFSTPIYAFPWGEDRYDYAYGFGWELGIYRGHHILTHGGAVPGYAAQVLIAPSSGIGIVVLTNHYRGYNVIDVAMRSALDRLLGLEPIDWLGRLVDLEQRNERPREATPPVDAPAISPPSVSLARYAGTYEHPGYGRYVIVEEARELRARFNHVDLGALIHRDKDLFACSLRLVPEIAFVVTKDGRVDTIAAEWVEGLAPLLFKRVSLPSP